LKAESWFRRVVSSLIFPAVGIMSISSKYPLRPVCRFVRPALSFSAAAQSDRRPGNAELVEVINLTGSETPYVGEITVPSGKSMVLRFSMPVSEASIGNPDTADIVPLTDQSVYVLGKMRGSTNLTLVGRDKRVLGVLDVQVSYDTLNLKRRLHDMLPGEAIEVRANGDSIVLSGKVSSNAAMMRALQIAEPFAAEKIVNAMELGASQQVMLQVRFAEVERSASKALGISTNALFDDDGIDGIRSNFVNPTLLESDSFAFLRDTFEIGNASIDVLLDALEQKGMATILAEPTLIALSGEPASFLAGGEFPVPVGSEGLDGAVRIQIEFKEFGVRLAFTPTVIGDKISLLVSPEVSELDPQAGIEINQVVIPGLKTRKASTTVELKNGQSFAIAGLMQKNFIDELNQMPGASSVPILGALMRSARYKRDETELAIIITPYIVEPVEDGSLLLPTDNVILPHEFELFALGQTEGGTASAAGGNLFSFAANLAGNHAETTTTLGYVVD
jgi:pilus assembly protein CpaC